jgi:hypothetical protein
MLSYGELNQFGTGSDPKLLHHVVIMEGDRAGRDFQGAGDLFHRAPLGQQFQDLALALA